MPGNNLSSYVDRAPHKVLLLLAFLQEYPETNESLAITVFLVYMTKVGVRTNSLSESISARLHESLVW